MMLKSEAELFSSCCWLLVCLWSKNAGYVGDLVEVTNPIPNPSCCQGLSLKRCPWALWDGLVPGLPLEPHCLVSEWTWAECYAEFQAIQTLPSVVPACFCPSSGCAAASLPASFTRCSSTGMCLACLKAACDLHWVWWATEWLRLGDRSDAYFLPVLRNLSSSPWPSRDNQEWLCSEVSQLPQHSWFHPLDSCMSSLFKCSLTWSQVFSPPK